MKSLVLSLLFLSQIASAVPGISHFAQVTSGVYRGGRPNAEGLNYLKQLGVRTDLSLQGGDLSNPRIVKFMRWWEPGEIPENIAFEREQAEALGLNFVNIPLNSMQPVTQETDAEIDRALEIICQPEMQPVFVHCERGKDRTGMVIALARVKCEGWSIMEAYREWELSGHTALAKFFTGNLDRYFFNKARVLTLERKEKGDPMSPSLDCEQNLENSSDNVFGTSAADQTDRDTDHSQD